MALPHEPSAHLLDSLNAISDARTHAEIDRRVTNVGAYLRGYLYNGRDPEARSFAGFVVTAASQRAGARAGELFDAKWPAAAG